MAHIFDSHMGECISLIIDQGPPGAMLNRGHKSSSGDCYRLLPVPCIAANNREVQRKSFLHDQTGRPEAALNVEPGLCAFNCVVQGSRDTSKNDTTLVSEECKELTCGGNFMDFIERIFGIAPDNGSGLLEILLFLIPIAGILLIREWRRRSLRIRKRIKDQT